MLRPQSRFSRMGPSVPYNEMTLRVTLLDAGFANILRCDYGKGARAEASGCGREAPDSLAEPWAEFYATATSAEA